ncbi:hypothetical protein EN20_15365, partial [Mycobacterium tuberculosis]
MHLEKTLHFIDNAIEVTGLEPRGRLVGVAVLRRLEGHFTLVFANADDPGTLVAARRSTPLVLGIGD